MIPPKLLASILLIAVSLPSAAAEVQVIINHDSGVTSATAAEIEDLYLGRKTKWAGGAKAVPLTNASADETQRFLSRFLDRTPSSFAAEWKRIVFTGKGSAPAEARDDREMIELVRKTPGAIGYVSAGAAVDGLIAVPEPK
jgi:ABC-type phosphate transport system substrate-binding protein